MHMSRKTQEYCWTSTKGWHLLIWQQCSLNNEVKLWDGGKASCDYNPVDWYNFQPKNETLLVDLKHIHFLTIQDQSRGDFSHCEWMCGAQHCRLTARKYPSWISVLTDVAERWLESQQGACGQMRFFRILIHSSVLLMFTGTNTFCLSYHARCYPRLQFCSDLA